MVAMPKKFEVGCWSDERAWEHTVGKCHMPWRDEWHREREMATIIPLAKFFGL